MFLVCIKQLFDNLIKIKFCKKYFNKNYNLPLPKTIKIKMCLKNKNGRNNYYLRFPYWKYPKRDGTKDLRRKNNYIKCERSVLYIDKYKIYSKKPSDIVILVKYLRLNNIYVELCQEEEKKKDYLKEKKIQIIKSNNIQNLITTYSKSSRNFEILCADIFESLGYNVELTPQTNDGGYDILLEKNNKYIIVECKCYSLNKKVGRPDIQKLVGANQIVKADSMIFITTSEFTNQAKDYANKLCVNLINGSEILNILEKQGFFNEDSINLSIEEIQLEEEDIREYLPKDIPKIHI